MTYWLRRNGALGRWAGDKALGDGERNWGTEATEMLELVAYGDLREDAAGEGTVSTDDVEKLLEFQVNQMQSKFHFKCWRFVHLLTITSRNWDQSSSRGQGEVQKCT